MGEPANLFAQQEANRRRSRWLVAGFIAFFAWLGFGADWLIYEATKHAPAGHYHHGFPWAGLLLSGVGAALAAYAWKTGPDKVLWSTGAREVTNASSPEELQLVNVVEEMAIAAGIPKPRVYVVDDPDPNAFATGHDANSSSIVVTSALLTLCSRDELQAVIAHEMGHIKNLDVRLMTMLAGLVGAVALMNNGMGRLLFRSGGRLDLGRSKDAKDLGPAFFVVLVLWIVSFLLAPLVTQLMALGVSRDREYLADSMSAQFTRNPLALASALQKIENTDAPSSVIKGGAAHLCIADPLGRAVSTREGWLADVLGTHPPMPIRIARLKAMGYQELKATGQFEGAPAT
jgi:heat shock protein HtpX